MEYFDITMTATLRPELIARTLESHRKNLFGDAIEMAKLIINVDMTGAKEKDKYRKLHDIRNVLQRYPFHSVWMNTADKPHFPTAFLWCMKRAAARWVFHLEEDWELVRPIDFSMMMDLMHRYPRLAHLRLSAFPSTDQMKCWNKFIGWNGEFFQIPEQLKGVIGWCGHPSLNRRTFIDQVLTYVNPMENPEKQFKGRRGFHPLNGIFAYHDFGVFHPQHTPKAEIDIGRHWMIEHGWAKAGNKAFFTNWQKVGEDDDTQREDSQG